MDNEEAEKLLKELSKFYNEPVMPLNRFCDAMTTWANCIEENNTNPELLGENKKGENHGGSYYKYLHQILVDIYKSNLLARLLYGQETFRDELCPAHKGHWDGQVQLRYGCPYGCDGTGWLVKDLIEREKHSDVTVDIKWEEGYDIPKSYLPPLSQYERIQLISKWPEFDNDEFKLNLDIIYTHFEQKKSFARVKFLDENGPKERLVLPRVSPYCVKFDLILNSQKIGTARI